MISTSVNKVTSALMSVVLKSLADPDPTKLGENVRRAVTLAVRLRLVGSYAYLGLYSQFREAVGEGDVWLTELLAVVEKGCSVVNSRKVGSAKLDALLGDPDALSFLVTAQQCGHTVEFSRSDADGILTLYGQDVADIVLGRKSFDDLMVEKGWVNTQSDDILEYWMVWHAFRRATAVVV